MPWKECSTVSQRLEFVRLASMEGANRAELCRRFGISRKTGYKWLNRFESEEQTPLTDRSRRPRRSPGRTSRQVEQLVLNLRSHHPAWGGRKLRHRLLALGHQEVPAASTITEILRRHGCLDALESERRQASQRFEYAHPNDLWQMDFKGDFALAQGGRCYPLTVLDDHSRYNLVLHACGDQKRESVRQQLIETFRIHGLPRRILADNGPPWGSLVRQSHWTKLGVWLLRLDVEVIHGRSYHPQTQGKEERFHRTLRAEVLRWHRFVDLPHVQRELDPWRAVYNHERPHEALDMATPAERYRPSRRSYPEKLPPVQYATGDLIRRVRSPGQIVLHSRNYSVGKAFLGHPVALRPTKRDGVWDVYFCDRRIRQIDERQGTSRACVRGGSARSARRATTMELP
jgi:transposase InsO family protein